MANTQRSYVVVAVVVVGSENALSLVTWYLFWLVEGRLVVVGHLIAAAF